MDSAADPGACAHPGACADSAAHTGAAAGTLQARAASVPRLPLCENAFAPAVRVGAHAARGAGDAGGGPGRAVEPLML